MEVKNLKAEAYDLLALIERAQRRLGEINQQIARLSQQPSVATPTPEVITPKKEEKKK